MDDAEDNSLAAMGNRDRIIVRASVVGIITNLALSAFKAAVGIAANSIAVILDAVNNLTDALSSIVTIVGTKIAGQDPDRKHPLGHGRVEYLSAMIVSGLVIYAGLTAAYESVLKMINPEDPDYSTLSLVIIAVAVLAKVVLGRYVQRQGERARSVALVASGKDALFDAVISFSVLVCAVIFMLSGLSLEPYMGAVISGFIIKAGVEMMSETLDQIVGTRADSELVRKVKEVLLSEPEVDGAYDLIIHNYGPERNLASVHLQLPDHMSVKDLDRLTRRLEKRVYVETGVILAGVGVYSMNTQDDEARAIQEAITAKVIAHEWALQVHGFYYDKQDREIRFDVVLSFDISPKEGIRIISEEVARDYPGFELRILPDIDISTSE
ncbi:MAG: cation diffusion facilitator family transporter [Succinivibrionaceae bacterium]|nr:cation diffusion facilitator family transporter [Succinivibrionaceae bacterium]